MKEKIVLGLGNNIDYEIVWDSNIFEDLVRKYDIRNAELTPEIEIGSERDLVISILGFLKSEIGGECFVADSEILENFAGYFDYRITMGGTSVRAAAAMGRMGYTSALHMVTLNDHVRRLLPEGCSYVCSASEEGIYPHLIIQFCQGISVTASDIVIRTSRSNRIIYVNDRDNTEMKLNADLINHVKDCEVFLISGFNAMQDKMLLKERLQTLLGILNNLPKNARV